MKMEIDLKKCDLIEILKLVDGKLIVKSLPSTVVHSIDCTWDECDEFASNVVVGVGREEYYICMPCEEHMSKLREFHKAGMPLEHRNGAEK
jgi:hypothetical protein